MITGTVEQSSKKEVKTKFGMKPTYSLKIDGEWYSCGFTDPHCSAGNQIAFSYTEGKYGKEIDKGSIMQTGTTPVPTPSPVLKSTLTGPATSNRPFPVPALHGDRAIIRQNALSHAARIVASGLGDSNPAHIDEQVAERVVSLARKFEAYACGDLDVERAREMAVAKELKGV